MTAVQKKWLLEVAGRLNEIAYLCDRMSTNPYNNSAKEKHVRGIFADVAAQVRSATASLAVGPPKKETKN